MRNRRIAVVGEAQGEQEEALQSCFCGPAGAQLLQSLNTAGILQLTPGDKKLLSEYWSTRDGIHLRSIWSNHPHIFLTNVFALRPKPTNDVVNLCGPRVEGIPNTPPLIKGKYVKKQYEPEIERLRRELDSYKPTLTIALGNTAIWALCGKTGINKWRGTSLLDYAGRKVLPTFHPSAILRQYTDFPIFIADLQKAVNESSFPEIRRPNRFIHIEPSYNDLLTFEQDYIIPSATLSLDIETFADQITEIGFAPSTDRCLVVPFLDERKPDKCYWPTLEIELSVWLWVKRICALPKRVVMQNGMYDMKFLWSQYGIPVIGATDDTMLLHHALQPEMKKSLGFLGSIYTNELAWKHMRNHGTKKKED